MRAMLAFLSLGTALPIAGKVVCVQEPWRESQFWTCFGDHREGWAVPDGTNTPLCLCSVGCTPLERRAHALL